MSREMKYSGIPWIGDIPKGWKVCFIKQIMRNKSIKGYPDEMVLSLYRDYGVVPKNSRSDNHNVTSEDTSSYKFVEVGDFVINKMKAWQGSMAVSEFQGIISPAYYICRFTSNEVNKRYIHYLLRNDSYKTEYMRLSSGLRVGQWDLNIDDFLRIKMVLPSLEEQQKIASFLDRKCAEVDEMIALQEKIVEELKAYKHSVITEAVTKGLNPDAPMRDSGIEWIGQIPEHWEVKRLKNIFRLKTGTTPDGFDIVNEDSEIIPWFTPSDISDDCCELHQSERKLYKSEVGEIELFPKGSLMFVGIGASAGKLGYSHISGYSNQQITALIPDNCNGKYYYYFLIADRKRLRDNAFFTTLPIINNGYLSQNKVVYPPTTEQQAIADYLDEKCGEIDNLISIKLSKIDSLKEYKKSIIYEYVTGKKK